MDPENRPKAALINQEWFDAAFAVLTDEGLGRVVVAACKYVFSDQIAFLNTPVEKAVFAMIRPALDSDIAKYRERCARNAANAKSQRQRVAASGTQSQRVGANTTPTTTPTPTPTPTPTSSLSIEVDEEREKWLIFGYFWSTGSKVIREECSAFWSYYESLGWKNNKGAQIVSKMAAARMWRRQFETGTPPAGAEQWFKAVQSCPISDCNAFLCFKGAERDGDKIVVRLGCSANFYKTLVDAVPTLEGSLKAAWRVTEISVDTIG